MDTKNIIIENFKSERAFFTKEINSKHSSVNKLTQQEYLVAVMNAITSEDGCARFETFVSDNQGATWDTPELIALGLLIDEVAEDICRANYSHTKSQIHLEADRQRQRDTFAMARGLKPATF